MKKETRRIAIFRESGKGHTPFHFIIEHSTPANLYSLCLSEKVPTEKAEVEYVHIENFKDKNTLQIANELNICKHCLETTKSYSDSTFDFFKQNRVKMESVNKKPKLKELPSDQLSGQNSLFMDEEELERAEEEYSLERADKEYEEYKRNTEDRIEPILQEFLACIKTIDKSTLKKMGKVVKDFEREWGEDGVDGLSIYLMSYVDHVLPNIEKEKLMQKVYIYKPRFFAEGEGFKKETIISETPIEWLADCQIPIEGGGQ